MNRPETALTALLFSVVIVSPAVAQQAPLTLQPAMSEFCSGCLAYLEFAPLEPESYAMRGQATETSILLPAAGESNGRLREQTVVLVGTSKQ